MHHDPCWRPRTLRPGLAPSIYAIETTVTLTYFTSSPFVFPIHLNPQNDSGSPHTSTPLSSLPIRSRREFASTLVPNMSSGFFSPSPRTGESIYFLVAVKSPSNRERASSKTSISATRRSLSTVLNRPVFALRANALGDTEIAWERSAQDICTRHASWSSNSKERPWCTSSYSFVPRAGNRRAAQMSPWFFGAG